MNSSLEVKYRRLYYDVIISFDNIYKSDMSQKENAFFKAMQQTFDFLCEKTANLRDTTEAYEESIFEHYIKKLKEDMEFYFEELRKTPKSHNDEKSVDLDCVQPLESKDQMPSFEANDVF